MQSIMTASEWPAAWAAEVMMGVAAVMLYVYLGTIDR
jgi:hypothetical protein